MAFFRHTNSMKEAEVFRQETNASLMKLMAFREEVGQALDMFQNFMQETRCSLKQFHEFRKETNASMDEISNRLDMVVKEEVDFQMDKAKQSLHASVKEIMTQNRQEADRRSEVTESEIQREKPSSQPKDGESQRSDGKQPPREAGNPAAKDSKATKPVPSAPMLHERLRVSGPASCRTCHGTYSLVEGRTIRKRPFWKRVTTGINGGEWLIYMDQENNWMLSRAKDDTFEADYLRGENSADMPFSKELRWQCWDRVKEDWAYDASIKVEPERQDQERAASKSRKAEEAKGGEAPASKQRSSVQVQQPTLQRQSTPENTMLFDLADNGGDESEFVMNLRPQRKH